MHIEFHGGADTVTGSRHILDVNGHRVLRDCGLYQGRRQEAAEINRNLAFDPTELHAVSLSHAHIDHSGNLPTLARAGYAGPIYTTTATAALCEVMLRDAAKIQEQDAGYMNQRKSRAGMEPIEPLYTMEDAEAVLQLFQGHHYRDVIEMAPGIRMTSHEAGHILGSELSEFDLEEDGRRLRVGFALDLGRHDLPLIRDPDLMPPVDVLVLESTYGDRHHDSAELADKQLGEIVSKTIERHGKVLIPSFALERAQEILYHLTLLISRGEIPDVPIYVDSPMATQVTRIFEKKTHYLDDEFHDAHEEIGAIFGSPRIHYVGSVSDSKSVTSSDRPSVVISASGMCEFGRILHHLKHGISNPRNSVVIVGYQAPHTLGRRLVEQETRVRIFGDWFERKAEVAVLNAFSAHADRTDLIEYAKGVKPKKVFLVHGEERARTALAAALKEEGIPEVFMPARGERYEL